MVLDSSAVIAVVFREEPHEKLEESIAEANSLAIGAPTLFETEMVALGVLEYRGQELVERFLLEQGVRVVPFDAFHWPLAIKAFLRYGKGRHPAGLNYGDCMTYAIARAAGKPLLFIGDDFAQTDIAPA